MIPNVMIPLLLSPRFLLSLPGIMTHNSQNYLFFTVLLDLLLRYMLIVCFTNFLCFFRLPSTHIAQAYYL